MPTEPTTEILVVRHAQSVWNAVGRWQGWADPPLSAWGQAQAHEAGRRLSVDAPFDAVVSSDLRRARRTAELVTSEAAGPRIVEIYPQLREHCVGEWSGLSRDEIDRRWPGQVEQWRRGDLDASPGGERRPDFEGRLLSGIRSVAADHPGQRVLVVSHGGAIRSISRLAGGELHHIEHLAGCWLRVVGDAPAVDRVVSVLGGPSSRPLPSEP